MKRILAVVVQIIAGYTLGFIVPFSLQVSDGMELPVIAVGMAAGVWLGGLLAYAPDWRRFLLALLGALLGSALLTAEFAFGYKGILFPFIGAMIGFYSNFLKKHSTNNAALSR